MRALVVYDPMFGSTPAIAEDVAERSHRTDGDSGCRSPPSRTRRTGRHRSARRRGTDPRPGMPRASTRTRAPSYADRSGGQLHLEEDADAVLGLMDAIAPLPIDGAAFETGVDLAPVLSGRASRGIAKGLSGAGCQPWSSPGELPSGHAQRAAMRRSRPGTGVGPPGRDDHGRRAQAARLVGATGLAPMTCWL